MIRTSTGTLFFHQKSRNCFPKIVSFLKMNGVRLEFSRVEVGYITQFIDLSLTSCSSGGYSTISSSRRTKPSKTFLLSESFSMLAARALNHALYKHFSFISS